MGSYMYDKQLKSPLADLIQAPAFMKPISDVLYSPTARIGELFDRPEDQVVYMIASTLMLLVNFGLYYHPGTPF